MSWGLGILTWRKLACLPLCALLYAQSAVAETYTYQVDFGTASSPVAEGYQAAEAGTLKATPDLDISATDGKGLHPIEIQFHGVVGGYSLGKEDRPLTTDGVYTFGSTGKDPMNIPFTISGLPPNAKVSFYAVRAWNGPGRAAFLSLGNDSMVDIAGPPDDDCDPKSISEFIAVCERSVVGPTGKMEGIFSNSDGNLTRPEGQWGAMVLVVETP
ncbi:hypothetical protein BH09VER1_BH09VER1_34730 [soil metagenome]